MQGGACSEDTGEDGKKDRQLHMQKRHFLKRNIHNECLSSETLVLLLLFGYLAQRNCGVSATHITCPSPYMSQQSAMMPTVCVCANGVLAVMLVIS